MYCTGCGTELNSDLNYCNRCGNRVAKSGSNRVAENLSQAISYVGGFGLLGFIFAVVVMLRKGVPTEAIVPISFIYLAALVAICFLIMRQIAAQTGKYPGPLLKGKQESEERSFMPPLTTAQLPEPTQQPASVTEHTTRILDKVPARR